MATEIIRIRKMLEANWDGETWYGANLKSTLSGIDAQKAFSKPGAGSHNIYELVMHLYCWKKFVAELVKGNTGYQVEINSEVDWPVHYETTEAKWNLALSILADAQTELMEGLNGFEDSRLGEIVPGRSFNWYVLLHGVLHHDIYHSAQISILKK
jgi:hypothetical protein